MDFDLISTQVGNETISGKITYYSPRDLHVEILSPYQNVSAGTHVPYFSSALIEENQVERMAKNFLISIYEKCEFARINKQMLQEKMVPIDAETNRLAELVKQLEEEKVNLKKTFKRGEITNIEYQRFLKPVKDQINKTGFEIHQCWREYVKLFPMVIPVDTDMEIVRLIKGL